MLSFPQLPQIITRLKPRIEAIPTLQHPTFSNDDYNHKYFLERRISITNLIPRVTNDSSFSNLDLQEVMKVLELTLFPELEVPTHNDYQISYGAGGPNGSYALFYPSHNFSTSCSQDTLINEDTLHKLYSNSEMKVLSVGSFHAYLERLLVEIGAIKKENILISDVDDGALYKGLNYCVFNMNEKWPSFIHGFDLIIFPESHCGIDLPDSEKNTVFHEWIPDNYFKDHPCQNNEEWRLKMLSQNGKALFFVLDQALKNLNSTGEIRITHSSTSLETSDLVEKKLNEAGHNIKITNNHSGLMTVNNLS